jgi:eukaryotic translation initiation factor 2C
VWPPPGASTTPRPAPAPYQPATAVYINRAATAGAYQPGVVYRTPAPTPYAPTPVTIRAPSPSPSPPTVRAPAPFQPARVSAPSPTPTPSTATIAKELEQKLFVSETALAPPAAAAAAASQAGQPAAERAPEVDLAPVSKKGLAHPARPGAGTAGRKVMIRANHFLVNVADNNLFHYDVRNPSLTPCARRTSSLFSSLACVPC